MSSPRLWLTLIVVLACAAAAFWLLSSDDVTTPEVTHEADPEADDEARVVSLAATGQAGARDARTFAPVVEADGRSTFVVEVRNEDGVLAGATVGYPDWDRPLADAGPPGFKRLGRTNKRGRLRLSLPAGQRAVVAFAPGHLPAAREAFAGGGLVRIVLTRALRTARIRVRTEGGEPLVQAAVIFSEEAFGLPERHQTNEAGETEVALPDFGNCRVVVSATGFHGVQRWYRAEELVDRQVIAMVLARAPPVRGLVMHATTHDPIAGATVSNGTDATQTTDAEGRFEIEHGDLVRITAEGFVQQNLRPGRGVRQVYLFPKPTPELLGHTPIMLRGRVLQADGAPAAGAQVASWWRAKGTTDAKGAFEIGPVGPQWGLVVHRGAWSLFIRGATQYETEIRLPPTAPVTGEVVFPDRPVPTLVEISRGYGPEIGASVPAPARARWVKVDEDIAVDAQGRFRIEALPVGTYNLVARVHPDSGLLARTTGKLVVSRDGGHARIVLDAGKVYRIRLLGPEGKPIARALVSGNAKQVRTDLQGWAELRGLPDEVRIHMVCAYGRKTKMLSPGEHVVRFEAPPSLRLELEREEIPEGTECQIEISEKEGRMVGGASGMVVNGSIKTSFKALDPSRKYEVGIKTKGFYSPWADLDLSDKGRQASATLRVFRWDEDEGDE